nr:unnamed protein product [Spirometra erinaceieuropaei]
MIFAARYLQERSQERRIHLYSTFVDLTKAFDIVNREGLYKVMQKFGCSGRLTQMAHQLHDGMRARVTDNGVASEAFAVTNRVKQGCVFTPILFSLMFSAMPNVTNAPGRLQDGRPALNQRWMHFQSRVFRTTVHGLLFADFCALNATS